MALPQMKRTCIESARSYHRRHRSSRIQGVLRHCESRLVQPFRRTDRLACPESLLVSFLYLRRLYSRSDTFSSFFSLPLASSSIPDAPDVSVSSMVGLLLRGFVVWCRWFRYVI
jgi:hypothetical protein